MKAAAIVIGTILATTMVSLLLWPFIQPKEPEPVEPTVQAIVQPKPSKYDVGPPTAKELLELVNKERKAHGVKPLKTHPGLMKSAQWKADDMAKYDYFSHKNHDGTQGGQKAYDFTRTTTGQSFCSVVSENIRETSTNIASSAYFMTGWKNSKPHYKAILDKDYSLTGIGVVYDKDQDSYIGVQHFCVTK